MQVSRILYSFATAFRRSAKQTPLSAIATPQTPDSDIFTFSVSLEIKEDDGKGYFRYRFFISVHTASGSVGKWVNRECESEVVPKFPFWKFPILV